MWAIRDAQLADAAAIEDFLVSVPEFRDTLHPGDVSPVWRWLFSRDGEPIENVLLAESPSGATIAHYGLSRLPYVVDGRVVEAGMACLLAIDEAYRKTPVFLDITTRLLKRFRAGDWSFLTGLANRSGLLEFHKAFGFKDIGEVPIYAKPIRLATIVCSLVPKPVATVLGPVLAVAQWVWIALLRASSGLPASTIRIVPLGAFDEATVATSRTLAMRHRYYAERGSVAVMNARFFSLPTRSYHAFAVSSEEGALGYAVLRVMDMKGYRAVGIVDICFDFSRRDIARAVFRWIDRFALQQRADLVSILANSPALLAALRAAGYMKTPESFRLVIYEPRRVLGLATSRIEDWFITWFEHDYV